MPLAETARLIASLELKDQFSATATKIDRSLTGLNRSMSRSELAGRQIGTGIRNGAYIAAGAVGVLVTQVGAGLRQLSLLEDATSQTNAVLKSTKSIAGQTAESIRNLAEKYEGLNATIDDKVIQSGENLLLTFTNIRKQAFEPALEAALNMNQALGGGEAGLQGTIQKLGKALNDPIKGLTALGRVGVTFTAQQKDQIKAAVAANDTFTAQKIILDELSKRFGGSFAAAGKTAKGSVAGIGDAVEDLQKTLAAGLLPVIEKVLPKIRAALADPAVLKGVADLGNGIASLFSDENIKTGGAFLKSTFETLKAAAPVLKDAGAAMLNIVRTAVGVFTSLPKEVQQLAIGAFAINKLTGGLVTNVGSGIAGGIAEFLAKKFTGGMNVTAAVVNVNGGVAGSAGGAGVAAGTGNKIVAGLTAATIVGLAVPIGEAFAAALPAEFKGAGGLGKTDSQLAAEFNAAQRATQGAIDKNTSITSIVGRALKAAIVGAEGQSAAVQVRATERVENATDHQRSALDRVRDSVESNRIALASAATKIAGAASAAGRETTSAINQKDLSFNLAATIIASTNVSLRSLSSKTRTTFKLRGGTVIS